MTVTRLASDCRGALQKLAGDRDPALAAGLSEVEITSPVGRRVARPRVPPRTWHASLIETLLVVFEDARRLSCDIVVY